MAIKRPDIYEHNNPVFPIVDSDFTRGGFRSSVATLNDLYALSGNSAQLKENSTVVYVTSEDDYYILIDIDNIGISSGWNTFGGNGVDNGLSIVDNKIVLGGTLSGNTTINNNNYTIKFTSDETESGYLNIGLNSIYSNSSFKICTTDTGGTNSSWNVEGNSTNITLEHNESDSGGSYVKIYSGGTIELNSKISGNTTNLVLNDSGLTYTSDYSTNFTDRSLVDKKYVDDSVCNNSNLICVRNVTASTYTVVSTDDFIGVSGSSCICLNGSPNIGQRVIVSDICGDALANPIIVDGNGNSISGSACSIINTDYGSMTYIYNGNNWSGISFIS